MKRCKSCDAKCITTRKMYGEELCYYCYLSFSSFLIKHWKRTHQAVDGNSTIELPPEGPG